MKKKFGLELIVLAFIFLFVGSDCFAQPSAGEYTVYHATGGHMNVGDTFEIVETKRGSTITARHLDPNGEDPVFETMNDRWNVVGYQKKYELTVVNSEALCGFIEVNTEKHKDNKFGHAETHGVLIKKMSGELEPGRTHKRGKKVGKEYIKIFWSARPLDSQPSAGQSRTEICNAFESDASHHGGIAHANN